MTALEDALARAEEAIEPGMHARLVSCLAARLPERPYWPGMTPRPESGVVFEISDAAADAVTERNWRSSEAWAAGFVLLRRGYYWEAHEVWEPVWHALAPNGAERVFVQAAIQHANAELKAAMGRSRAAARLRVLAMAHLKDACARGFRPEG